MATLDNYFEIKQKILAEILREKVILNISHSKDIDKKTLDQIKQTLYKIKQVLEYTNLPIKVTIQ